jgi:hypothetical protein
MSDMRAVLITLFILCVLTLLLDRLSHPYEGAILIARLAVTVLIIILSCIIIYLNLKTWKSNKK